MKSNRLATNPKNSCQKTLHFLKVSDLTDTWLKICNLLRILLVSNITLPIAKSGMKNAISKPEKSPA